MNILKMIRNMFRSQTSLVKSELQQYFKDRCGYHVTQHASEKHADIYLLSLENQEHSQDILKELMESKKLVVNISTSKFDLPDTIYGFYQSNHVVIGGSLVRFVEPENLPKVLCILSSHNEADILSQSIQHILSEGCDVHVVDDWSIDETAEILSDFASLYPNRFFFERFPEGEVNDKYEWRQLLQRKEAIANLDSNYDWFIHYDADEIRTSLWKGVSLQSAIGFVEQLGFNAIDFTVVDYRPTKDGFSSKDNPSEFFTCFEFGSRPGHFLQIKGWKHMKHVDVNLSDTGGHAVRFEGRNVYPIKFLLKHFSFRSNKQGNFKVHGDRLKRISEKERSWNIQYEQLKEKRDFIYHELDLFSNRNFDEDFVLQRLFGAGVK